MISCKKQGFTIVELMIAIALGMLIIAGLAQIYLSNRDTFIIQEGLARLQENGRYANYTINKDLRMIGFMGCSNQNNIKITNLIKNPTTTFDMDNLIRGYDSSSSTFSPALPANLASKAIPGSDVIEIKMASSTNDELTVDMHKSNNPIRVNNRLTINAGDPLLITDCKVGDLFIAGANSNPAVITHSSNENIQNSLSTAYSKSAKIMRFVYYAYYVKNTGRNNENGQPIYALVRQDSNGIEEEIADGIEKMRIRYAVNSNNDKSIDIYLTATQVGNTNNWNNVLGLEISFLLSTPEEVNNKSQSYVFNDVTTTPTDRKLRRVWNTFIKIRNRGL